MATLAEKGAVTLANWRQVPFSRWAFRNTDRFISVAPIPHDPLSVRTLPERPVPLDGFALALPGGGQLDLSNFLHATVTDALVVLKDGALAFEHYDGGNDAHGRHIAMSATKSVIGLLAGILAGQGTLALETPVSDLVPEVADSPFAGATLRHLLDMRAGVRLDASEQRAYEAATGWEPGSPGEDLCQFFASLKGPAAAHGGPFRYVSANTDLLGIAIERVTGRPIADLLSACLWAPMGAADDAAITLDPAGMARCTGGLCATARDLARLGQLVLDGGAGVVPADWLAEIARGGDRDAWATGEWGQAFAAISPTLSYRSGWYVTGDAHGMLFAMGVYGQNLFVDPADQLVIAKLSSQAEPVDYRAIGLTHLFVAQLRRHFSAVAA